MPIDSRYDSLDPSHRRIVNQFVTGLASGDIQPKVVRQCLRKSRLSVDGSPKRRPPSAYISFYKSVFSDVRDELDGAPMTQVASEIGTRWRSMTPIQKAKYKPKSDVEDDDQDDDDDEETPPISTNRRSRLHKR